MNCTVLGGPMWKQHAVATLAVLGLLYAVAGCKNPRYCAGNPNDDCMAGDAAGSCTSDHDCAAPQAVCDTSGGHICVQCTASEPEACGGATPACIDTRGQPCTMHAQCLM